MKRSRLVEWCPEPRQFQHLDLGFVIRNQSILLKCPSATHCILNSHVSKKRAQKRTSPSGPITHRQIIIIIIANPSGIWVSVTLGYLHCEAYWLSFHWHSCSIYVVRCVLSGWQNKLWGLLLYVPGCHNFIIKLKHPVQKYHARGEIS